MNTWIVSIGLSYVLSLRWLTDLTLASVKALSSIVLVSWGREVDILLTTPEEPIAIDVKMAKLEIRKAT